MLDAAVATKDKDKDKTSAWEGGVIKWFDTVRRYGFILPDAGNSDVFLHFAALQSSGVREADLREGVRVKFKAKAPDRHDKRPHATHVALVRSGH